MLSQDAAQATSLAQILVGQQLTQLCAGIADAQLHFSAVDASINLWSPIRAATAATDLAVDPYGLDGVAVLLPLLNSDVVAVQVADSGELSLTIGETTVSCASDPGYEAWSLTGRQGTMVVCVPGGRLEIWGAPR